MSQGRQRATRHDSLVGRSLHGGTYHIQAVLGHGGMGQVFLASYSKTDVPVALKQVRGDQPLPESVIEELDHILHEEDISITAHSPLENDFPVTGGANTDRFLREALLLARLSHSALPALFDYFFEDGYWYLVMEYIPGPTLAMHIHQHAPLPPLEAINYALQLCSVLDYFHEQSPPVIFRDLKPSNIILHPDGRLVLVDLGIARYFKEGQVNDTTDFGSPGYASPEQCQGIGQTDARSDLYSLGVILHEMLSGQRPVRSGDRLEPLRRLNPTLSPVLSALVSVATRAEPGQRFQSASTFYQAVERAYAIEERRAMQRVMLPTSTIQTGLPASTPHSEQPMAAIQNSPWPPASDHNSGQPPAGRPQRSDRNSGQPPSGRPQGSAPTIHGLRRSFRSLCDGDGALRSLWGGWAPALWSVRTRRVLSICCVLLLLLALVLTSLSVYQHVLHAPRQHIVQGRSTPTTIAVTPPAVNGSWQMLPSFPSPEADNTATYVQIQGRASIYISGGFRGPKALPRYDRTLYHYDITTAHWETVTNAHFPGMVNNAVAVDEHNDLFYTAGYSSDTYTVPSLLYMYGPGDGQVQKIVPPTQMPIGFGSAIVADQQGHLYIAQGFMQAGQPRVLAGTGWYRYDTATGQWHQLAPLPVGLGYVVLAPDGQGGILMLGGSRDAGQQLPTRQIFRYDIAQNAWAVEQTNSPSAFSGAASCLDGYGHIVIVGGYDALHDATLAQVWLVDVHTLQWVPLASLPSGSSFLGAAACDGMGHVYLVRGAADPAHPTADFWELTIHS